MNDLHIYEETFHTVQDVYYDQSITHTHACTHINTLEGKKHLESEDAKKVTSKCSVNYTHRIEYIEYTGSNNTRLRNIEGCLMIKALWLWSLEEQGSKESRNLEHNQCLVSFSLVHYQH